jgi:hypothetical protein
MAKKPQSRLPPQKQQQIYSRLWCSDRFVNKTDDHSDDRPLDEVSHSLSQSEFQPDVQVHIVVQHKCANHENANENAQTRTFRSARRKTGDRRNVPQFFDEWRLVNVRSVPSFFNPQFVKPYMTCAAFGSPRVSCKLL